MGRSDTMLRFLLASSLLAGCRPHPETNDAFDFDPDAPPSDGLRRRLRGLQGAQVGQYVDPSTVTFKVPSDPTPNDAANEDFDPDAPFEPVPNNGGGGLPLVQTDAAGPVDYVPATCEAHVLQNAERLGFASERNPPTCQIWKDPTVTGPECHLGAYSLNLQSYNDAVENFEPIPDLFPSIQRGDYSVCDATRLHDDGLEGFFRPGELSRSSSGGYVEPLLPPMRSVKNCYVNTRWDRSQMLVMDYFVHDFEAMCRRLKPTSRKVLIDMGASLEFHSKGKVASPIVHLLDLYEKFGFRFDHIYGFEITFSKPKDVWEKLLPEKYLANYHWINTGVTAEEGNRMNPLHSILGQFNEDDFIVVKLDIDTSSIEVPLAHQVLDGGPDGIYHRLIDQFYFEHHVHIKEIYGWYKSAEGTIRDSLELFAGLRERGVPAHFWP